MVGEGLARAITIISIILTVGSLALAFALARRRSRIRPGFDAARAVVGVGVIVVVALLAHTWAPVAATVPAIAAGLASLRPGGRHQYQFRRRRLLRPAEPHRHRALGGGDRRRAGGGHRRPRGCGTDWSDHRLVQRLPRIGLIVGRNRPLRRARQASGGAAVAAVILALALPVVFAGVAGPRHALAAPEDLTRRAALRPVPAGPGLQVPGEPRSPDLLGRLRGLRRGSA